MPIPSPTAPRDGVRADARTNGARARRATRPVTLPIRRAIRPLCAGIQEIPAGAHSFRYRVLDPGQDIRVGDLRSRVVHESERATVVIDYLTEEQARVIAAADSGFSLGS